MLRIVIDTNIFISSVINPKGKPARLIHAWKDGKIQLVVSEQIIEEIAETFKKPKIAKYTTSDEVNNILIAICKYSILTPGNNTASLSDDPDDNMLLACSEEGEADYLVTGDNDLLRLGEYKNTDIVSVEHFLNILEMQEKK